MPEASTQVNPYMMAFDALSLREEAAEPRAPRSAEMLAERYCGAMQAIVAKHVAGEIVPPLPASLSDEMLEVFQDYQLTGNRSREPRIHTRMDLTEISGYLVSSHKQVFGAMVRHGLSTLGNGEGA